MKKLILTIGLLAAITAVAQIVIQPVTNTPAPIVSIPNVTLNSNQTALLVSTIAANAANAGILFSNVNLLDGNQHRVIFTIRPDGSSLTTIK
jgi:hypothetical protein